MVAIIKKISFFIPFFCYIIITNANADYQWRGYSVDVGRHSTPLSACEAAVRERYALPSYGWAADFSTIRVNGIQYQYINPPIGNCGVDLYEIKNPSNTNPEGGAVISRVGSSCDPGKIFSPVTGICEASNADLVRKQTGTPPLQSCATSDLTFIGNPINFSNGNKFQAEVDYRASGHSPITVMRYYNSIDGVWRHSYSTRLTISYEGVMLTFADGRQSLFSRSGTILVAEPTELGELKLEGAVWTYTSPTNETYLHFGQFQGVNRVVSVKGEPSPNCPISNSSYTYDDRGQVKTKTNAEGFVSAYTYNERGLEIERVEASGTPLARTVLTEWDPSRPLPKKIIEADRTIFYTYDSAGQLLSQQISAN